MTTTLQQHLRDAGYDLIDGPLRNHQLLQLWLKKGLSEPELYYANLLHAFTSDVKLKIKKDPGLSVSHQYKNDYAFQIGITLLQEWMQGAGLPAVDLSSAIGGGSKVSISYQNTQTEVVPLGELTQFFSQSDFLHPNPVLLRNANRNNILVITGLVTAENLVADISTTGKINTKAINALKKQSGNRIEFSGNKTNSIRMVAGKQRFPVAVKASRIDFDKGRFNGLTLVTDGRGVF